jgi:predicted component of type VI protein secretion system
MNRKSLARFLMLFAASIVLNACAARVIHRDSSTQPRIESEVSVSTTGAASAGLSFNLF